jgi:HK97 family phage major capsid protein
MSDRLKELREKRGKIVNEMREITEQAQTEKRDLTDEELSKHGTLFDEQERVAKQLTAEERSIEAARLIADRQQDKPEDRSGAKTDDELRMEGFRTYLRSGRLTGEGAAELRAYQAGSEAEGGFLVAPQQFVQELIKAIDDAVHIRGMARTFQVPMAESLGAPTLDTDAEDWDWTTELQTGNEEDTLRFGKRELRPHPVAKRVKMSRTLLRKSLMPADQMVMDRMAYKLGVTQEKAFLTGTGVQQPLGVFTASTLGISTARDVSTGNTATEIQWDGLREAKYTLKGGYWKNAEWMFHRDAVKGLSKLKDGDGQYLWQPSVKDGDPDKILSFPFRVSEFVPNTFTSGLYVGILGDFSHYWIVDALSMQMQALYELYAETNQVGFIGRLETDAMPVLEEAFVRVKLG